MTLARELITVIRGIDTIILESSVDTLGLDRQLTETLIEWGIKTVEQLCSLRGVDLLARPDLFVDYDVAEIQRALADRGLAMVE